MKKKEQDPVKHECLKCVHHYIVETLLAGSYIYCEDLPIGVLVDWNGPLTYNYKPRKCMKFKQIKRPEQGYC